MTEPSPQGLADQVTEALRVVIDPELGYNIVDLGLIYCVAAEPSGTVHIAMTTTTRGCPATSYLTDGAREAARLVAGVGDVDVTLTYDPPWRPDMMSQQAKDHIGFAGSTRGGW